MSDLTDRLDQIQARAEAATEGPWDTSTTSWEPEARMVDVPDGDDEMSLAWEAGGGLCVMSRADAEFVAAARADVPALVAALRGVLDQHYDAGPSQGHDFGPDGGYGWADHCCATCGAHGEYGVEWPCPTIAALDGDER